MNFDLFQHSVFLQALGAAIINSLWQCFALWLLYTTIVAFNKQLTAKFKTNLSTSLLFVSFLWFTYTFFSKFNGELDLKNVVEDYPVNIITEPAVYNASGFKAFLQYLSATLPYLSAAYILLLTFLIIKLCAAYKHVYTISNKHLIQPPFELQGFTTKVTEQLKITKKISVWISNHLDVPATIGCIKPVILIPFASINNLSPQQLEAIILHELAHIKRNDYLINIFISLVETILFFNPFIVLLAGIAKRERENCCDDFVLQDNYDAHSYASALLQLEQFRLSKLRLAIGAVSGKKQLLSRIQRITGKRLISPDFNYKQKLVSLALITFILCSFACLMPNNKDQAIATALTKKMRTQGLAKIDQPAISPKQDGDIINKPKVLLPGLHKTNKLFKEDLTNVTGTNEDELLSKTLADMQKEGKDSDFFSMQKLPGLKINNLKFPQFYFDAKGFKLLQSFNFKEIANKNFNIDLNLSQVDIKTLNKNLKEAYKQINQLDWKKIQDEISKSLQEEKEAFSKQKEEMLLQIQKTIKPSQKNNKPVQQFNDSKKIIQQLINEVNQQKVAANMQETGKKKEDKFLMFNNSGAVYSYSYVTSKIRNQIRKKTLYTNFNVPLSINRIKKDIDKIAVKNLSRLMQAPDKRISLSLTFNEEKKNNPGSIVSVEVGN